MTVNELQDGQTVKVRTGRYREGLYEPEWSPWRNEPMYVQRDKKGNVCTVALRSGDWAEYDPRHDPPVRSPAGVVLLCEDYYLEIEGLTP